MVRAAAQLPEQPLPDVRPPPGKQGFLPARPMLRGMGNPRGTPGEGTSRPPLSPLVKKDLSPGPRGSSEGPGPTEGAGWVEHPHRLGTFTGRGQVLHNPRLAVSRLFAHILKSLCRVWGLPHDPTSRQHSCLVTRPWPMCPPGPGRLAGGQQPRSVIRLSRSSCTNGKLSCLGTTEQTRTGTASPPASCQPGAPTQGEAGGASAGLGWSPGCVASTQ